MAEPIIPLDTVAETAKDLFKQEYQEECDVAVFAPGRVNLIGEHTDYNNGYVMPMALPLVTVIVGKKISGTTSTIITSSEMFKSEPKAIIDMDNISRDGPKWALYVKGVLAKYKGGTPPAFKALIYSTVPIGGGLASSAALEVAMYTFLDELVGPNDVTPLDKVLACQMAEHEYPGMPCGIMDQYISLMARQGFALLIDCQNLTSELIEVNMPLRDPNVVVLIINSNVKHELTGSEYPTRKRQCQKAAELMNKSSLREATEADVKALNCCDLAIKMRARHVVGEIKRTLEGADALYKADHVKFGKLMVESHVSLRDDYNVSCEELDELVRLAMEVDGVLGSRMTGAGFGGCTVTLVKVKAADRAIETIKKKYRGTATFYVCSPFRGAGKVEGQRGGGRQEGRSQDQGKGKKECSCKIKKKKKSK